MYPLPFELPSHSGPHCVLSRVHCAVQYVLIEIESENRSLVSTFCDPMACTVHGILQARILEWVAFPFSRGSSQPRDQTLVSLIAGGFFPS